MVTFVNWVGFEIEFTRNERHLLSLPCASALPAQMSGCRNQLALPSLSVTWTSFASSGASCKQNRFFFFFSFWLYRGTWNVPDPGSNLCPLQ